MPPGSQRDQDRVKNSSVLLTTQRGEPVLARKRIDPEGCRLEFRFDTGSGKWKLYAQFPTGSPLVVATEP